jgi:hypothetical protein
MNYYTINYEVDEDCVDFKCLNGEIIACIFYSNFTGFWCSRMFWYSEPPKNELEKEIDDCEVRELAVNLTVDWLRENGYIELPDSLKILK